MRLTLRGSAASIPPIGAELVLGTAESGGDNVESEEEYEVGEFVVDDEEDDEDLRCNENAFFAFKNKLDVCIFK
ncbi:hypothetical protein BGZ76_001785, partial [Entomortierella beljakovae]